MPRPASHTEETSTDSDAVPREARLEIRLTRQQKALVIRAAAARGATLADFVRQAVQAAAVKAVAEAEVLRLSVSDQEAFAAAVLAPREPSAALKSAYEDYREQMGA